MLQITDIYKEYRTGTLVQKALDGVSLSFRENEFVAILGPSGSGKTTLLNIIGGLDHCDSGELMIDGVPTARYRSRDWDSYRNHSVGFIFQSYNLIPHQTLLRNVELALILSGVSAKERRIRAEEELDRVGLKEQMRKKPAQLSGGQMQRVAIARALVNHPTIVLADEPTGALDSDTGEQVMQLLKEVAQDHLVVMVTHNPDLAERYANRIIRLRDGKVVSDSNPYDPSAPMVQKETGATEASEQAPAAQIEISAETAPEARIETSAAPAPAVSLPAGSAYPAPAKRVRKPSMSFLTALSLSVSNLLSKKARTILVAFAASIGITGIALILSPSSFSMDASMQAVAQLRSQTREAEDGEGVREQQILGSMLSGTSTNDLKSLKNWFDSGYSGIEDVTRSVSYSYGISPLVYLKEENGYRQVNPDQTMSTIGISVDDNLSGMMSLWSSNDAFCMLPAREELYQDSYKVLAGHWPQNASECVLVLLPGGRVPDYLLYSMGLKDAEELNDMITGVMTGEAVDTSISSNGVYDPQEFLGISFKLLPASRRFRYDKKLGVWLDRGDNEAVLNDLLDDAKDLVIAGVVMPDDEKALGIVQIGIDFLPEAMEELIAEAEKSPVVQAQLADPETDVLTGSPFGENTDDPFGGMADMIEIHPENMPDAVSVDLDRLPEVLDKYGRLSAQETVRVLRELRRTGESPTLKEAVEELIPALMSLFEIDEDKIGELISFEMDEARMQEMYAARASAGESSLKGNLTRFGYADPESPGMITIYPKDFESKDRVIEILESYNRAMEKEGQEDKVITYTDYVGSLMSSVTTIIDVITYVLIAFVAVSLVVSSIMIGIITYISVLERRKEIGILRAMGASRHNVSQVFNAETFIIGSLAGIFGIALTLLLLIPINAAIHSYTDEPVSAFLPPGAAGILIALCVVLNLIGGFIPARKAAKQDPVTALRSE